MSRLTEKGATAAVEVYTTSTDLSLGTLVGSRYDTSDGREFVLVQNGGTALVAGKLVQSVPNTANHIGLTTVSFTAYSANGNIPASVVVTAGGTGFLANEYAGGYATVPTSTGAGQILKIASNTAQTSTTGNATIVFENEEGQNMVALVGASSTISLFRNPYGSNTGGTASTGAVNFSTNGVIVNPTTTTGKILGVSTYAIAASTSTVATYGLIQTKGTCVCLNHSGTTIGLNVGNSTQSTPVAGAVETYAAASNTLVGYASQAGTDTQYGEIVINL